MKISEAIENLKQIQKSKGDIDLAEFVPGDITYPDTWLIVEKFEVVKLEQAWNNETQSFCPDEYTEVGTHSEALEDPRRQSFVKIKEMPKTITVAVTVT